MISLPNPLDKDEIRLALDYICESSFIYPLFDISSTPTNVSEETDPNSDETTKETIGVTAANSLINTLRLLNRPGQHVQLDRTDLERFTKSLERAYPHAAFLCAYDGIAQPYTNLAFLNPGLEDILRHTVKCGREGRVKVSVARANSFPKDAVLIPENAEKHNEFMAFRVDYPAAGLPSRDKCLLYLTEPGARFYLAGLAARAVQAPVDMKRTIEKRNLVTFYHPIYTD